MLELAFGEQRPNFGATTTPPTTWEIKSLQDIDDVQTVETIQVSVQGKLRKARQPYILSITGLPQKLKHVAAGVKKVVDKLITHDEAHLPVPHTFTENGLVVTADKRQRDGKGYAGSFIGSVHQLGAEYSMRVRGRIKTTCDLLPADSAGGRRH